MLYRIEFRFGFTFPKLVKQLVQFYLNFQSRRKLTNEAKLLICDELRFERFASTGEFQLFEDRAFSGEKKKRSLKEGQEW